ncbi:MAG: Spy/CpxP family protein refolding chaperone [Geminicoccaceae bacterium]
MKKIILIGGLAVFAIAATVAGAHALRYADTGLPGFSSIHGDHRGWGHRGRGGAFTRVCDTDRLGRLDRMIGFVERRLDLGPDQEESWDGLLASIETADATVAQRCDELRDQVENAETAPERLALMEAAVATGLEVIQEVRPAFDTFYASLDEDQKEQIDGLANRRQRDRDRDDDDN